MSLACPSCSTALVVLVRSGVTIDACPSCRGVWLDRGELDRLIASESTADDDFVREMTGTTPRSDDRARQVPVSHHDDDDDFRSRGKRKRRSSLFSEIFDFD